MCAIINAYFRVVLSTKDDATYYLAPVLVGCIVEVNVGIVVGCMPVISAALLSRFAKAFHVSSLRSFISRLSFNSRSSKRGGASSDKFQQLEASNEKNNKPHLETRILEGADGKGKFMNTQRSWLSRSLLGTWTSTDHNHTMSSTTDDSVTLPLSRLHRRPEQQRHKNYVLEAEEIRNVV
jgi:hypothetical protein